MVVGVPWVPLLQVKHWVLVANIEGRPWVEPRLEENILEHEVRSPHYTASQVYLLVLLVLLVVSLRQVGLLGLLGHCCHGGSGRRASHSLTRTSNHTSYSSFYTTFHASLSYSYSSSSSVSLVSTSTSSLSMVRLCWWERLAGLDSAVKL